MIRNIEDLLNFTRIDLQDTDDLRRKRIFQDKIGCSNEDIINIEKEIGHLPLIYKNKIIKFDLYGKILGFFSLYPVRNHNEKLVDSLITANRDNSFLPLEFLKERNLVCIGSRSDYTICVAQQSSYFNEDQIVLVDEEIIGNEDNPRPEDIQIAADNFEQFLIIIGNLNQLHREVEDDESNYDKKREEFIERLTNLNVNEKYYEFWKLLF
jgi:hypothetical protein